MPQIQPLNNSLLSNSKVEFPINTLSGPINNESDQKITLGSNTSSQTKDS